ncbi:MAG: phosphohistidine phosphatase SixA [Drouetiella hepatica Uher 2000/2452]|jgi:phosphohistidine phosphatase|uniref:Phosphohistidine phosphatase SixA n=1 Tax=Drouetiella hepatica Uher 2000/2452 TaxID=904376 RepID=A0A951QJL4_9CYAN|nr:phosphohistidine phosphatase SixA [Drouetiella hepatica Uher 2000/2452]
MSAIELYLIRHGIAAEHGIYPKDSERPLTDEGQEKTRQVAQRLYELDIRFDLIQTSPLVRARQTANILQSAGLGQSLEESSHLAPEGSFEDWVSWLRSWKGEKLAIVGHEPNLGEWTERLVWGSVHHQIVVKKAAVIGLLLPETGSPAGKSQLFWLTPPRLLL